MSEFIGRNLGPYRITEQLGMGGMATVYKAYQPSMDRYVAIKVLPQHFAADPTFVGRFEQEAKVIARLENARILPVYDYGEDNGVTYIVMRFLEGGTLAERIQSEPLSLVEIARIIGQIAEGLDYAHKRGVIHRDMKPSNIMLDPSSDVYITDFGISKLVEGTAQFTGSGIIGTPAYISPEQGLGQPVDHRTDIYSLGVVLYQLATNDVPFHAETPMAVVIKHIHEPLPLPRSINPVLPETVETVILKALAKDPDARYQSCGELAKALTQAVAQADGKTIPSSKPTEAAAHTRPIDIRDHGETMPAAPLQPAGKTRTVETYVKAKRPLWMLPVGLIGGLFAVCFLAVILMMMTGACPPSGPWPMPPWCGVSQRGNGEVVCPPAGPWPMPPGCESPEPTQPSQMAAVPLPETPVQEGDGRAEPGVESLFHEDFEGEMPKEGWQWINDPGDQQRIEMGHLIIPVLPGSSIGGERVRPKMQAPALVRRIPPDMIDFSFQVTLRFTPRQNFQGAGLIALSERQIPMLSLTRSFCDQPAPCQKDAIQLDNWLVWAKAAGYQPAVMGENDLPPDGTVQLRITLQAGEVTGFINLKDQWQPVAKWPLVAADRVGFIGLVTTAGGQNADKVPAEFDDFMVLPPAGP